MRILDKLLRKSEATVKDYIVDPKTPQVKPKKPGCKYCRAVITAGRSGEQEVKFDSGDVAKVEIINESGVEGRMCYSLNIMNDIEIGWNEIPVNYCPFCGRYLKERRK